MLKKFFVNCSFIILIMYSLIIPVYATGSNSLEQNQTVNQNIDSVDYEIAKILFKSFLGNEFSENSISNADYNYETKEFSCEYVLKSYDELWKTDNVKITSNDFITYKIAKTTYEIDEETQEEIPYTINADYTDLNNEDKNSIINLAHSKGYETGKNLTDEEFLKILEIVFLNDTSNLKSIINENEYVLKNYYISGTQIHFIYLQENNESNNIEISSWLSGLMGWNVDGESNVNIFENTEGFYIYDGVFDNVGPYCIDYDIEVKERLSELEAIENEIWRTK